MAACACNSVRCSLLVCAKHGRRRHMHAVRYTQVVAWHCGVVLESRAFPAAATATAAAAAATALATADGGGSVMRAVLVPRPATAADYRGVPPEQKDTRGAVAANPAVPTNVGSTPHPAAGIMLEDGDAIAATASAAAHAAAPPPPLLLQPPPQLLPLPLPSPVCLALVTDCDRGTLEAAMQVRPPLLPDLLSLAAAAAACGPAARGAAAAPAAAGLSRSWEVCEQTRDYMSCQLLLHAAVAVAVAAVAAAVGS